MGEAIRVLETPKRKSQGLVLEKPKNRKQTRIRTKTAPVKTRTKNRTKNIANAFRLFAFFATIFLVLGLLIVSVMSYNRLAVLNKEIASTKNDIAVLQAEHDYLQIKLEPYVSKGRIENLAKTRLNMDYPKQDQIAKVTIDRDVYPTTVVRSQDLNPESARHDESVFASVSDLIFGLLK